MKKFFINVLTGLIPVIMAIVAISLFAGLSHLFTVTPPWVLYTFIGIVCIAILYIMGSWIRQ